MPRPAELLLLLGTAVFAVSCASNPKTPDGWLVDAEEAARDPWGGWAVVEQPSTPRVAGELIAVHPDSVFLLPETGRLVGLDRAGLGEAVVVKYRPATLYPWALLGGVSTISNGAFLLFTAPMWAIGGVLATRSENVASRIEIPPRPWEEAAPFARFPQGIPPDLDRGTLNPKRLRRSPSGDADPPAATLSPEPRRPDRRR